MLTQHELPVFNSQVLRSLEPISINTAVGLKCRIFNGYRYGKESADVQESQQSTKGNASVGIQKRLQGSVKRTHDANLLAVHKIDSLPNKRPGVQSRTTQLSLQQSYQ